MILKHGYMTIDTMEFILGKAYVAWPVMAHLPNTGTIHGPITGSKKKKHNRGGISVAEAACRPPGALLGSRG